MPGDCAFSTHPDLERRIQMSRSTDPHTAQAARGQCQTIDLVGKIALINGHWQPRVVAEMNDYQFKVVKLEGDFVWHKHDDTDETFIVLDGELSIDFRGGSSGDGSIVLSAGQMAIVPKGVEHKPRAHAEVKLLLIEPRGVVNTGDGEASERTVVNDQWI
jgi:mannose-6-phosphate isomerase-like protein (cupin superfamily)